MRHLIVTLATLLFISSLPVAWAGQEQTFQWDPWRHLPVLEGGRHKPFDTLAWETTRLLSNRAKVAEPDTGQQLDPHTFYLAILFEWQGWQQPPNPLWDSGVGWRSEYFQLYEPDKWDRAPLLRVDFLALRSALGLAEDQKYVSPLDLSRAQIELPGADQPQLFLRWAQALIQEQQEGFTTFEQKALELADKYWSYQDHRMGRKLQILPAQAGENSQWMSISQLMTSPYDDATDPTGELRQAKAEFQQARAAYFASSPTDFNSASSAFISTVGRAGGKLGSYPNQRIIDLEVNYNRWVPFRFAWVFTLVAFLCLLLSMGTGWKPFYVAGWVAFAAGLVAILIGFGMRCAISGRAPVTNMYESVLYLGMGVALFGLVFELIYRKQYILTAAAAVATVALILADNCPAALDPSLRPLQPVLRSNFWLVTHVMTITLSYAAFALALGIANITLGYYLVGSPSHSTISSLTRFTYKAIQVGVLLLAAGTILGGVWADYSWGRFWGWDPKEVWALVALLGYLAVLHARYAGWVRSFGLAALSVLCFSLVVMAWYGVNFVLGAGLHSYGFGGGGQAYVFSVVAVQMLYVAAAGIRAAWDGEGGGLGFLSAATK